MGFVTIIDAQGVQHRMPEDQFAGLIQCQAERDKLRADRVAAQAEVAAWKDYAESLCRIVGGQYLFYKERYGVKNKTCAELSRIIDMMDKARNRVAELLAHEGGK